MKTNTEATKEQTPKIPTATEPKARKAKKSAAPVIDPPAAQPEANPAKAAKAGKPAKVEKADADREATDRRPTTLAELKETKGGFVAHLFLTAKDMDAIAKELASAFKLGQAQSIKITRRITGRVRLYQRVFELVPAKK